MMRETREILESSEVTGLLSTCTKIGISRVLDSLSEIIPTLSADANPAENSSEFKHPSHVAVYVAKIIPALNNLIFQDGWPIQLLTIEPLRLYGANIYESFSTL